MLNTLSDKELFEKIRDFDNVPKIKVRKPSRCPYCKIDNMRRITTFPGHQNFMCLNCGKRF